MTVRYAKISDAAALLNLIEQLMEEKCELKSIKIQLKKILNNENHQILVCESESGKVLGTAMGVVCHDLYKGNFMAVENFVVDESARGKGMGRALMESLEKIAKKQDCWYMNLVSSSFRSGAHKFYEKVGFKRESGFRKIL